MPKARLVHRRGFHGSIPYKVGDRVIYIKHCKKIECWVEEISCPYIYLRPCFFSYANIIYSESNLTNIKKYKPREPSLYQIVNVNLSEKKQGIILEIDKPWITVQIVGTRINYKFHINSVAIQLTDLKFLEYIPYEAIDLKEERNLFSDVIVDEIRGYVCDYRHGLYLFIYWYMGQHKIKWVDPLEITWVQKASNQDRLEKIGTYTVPFKSCYPKQEIPSIIKHDPDLILLDMQRNISWQYYILKKLLSLYFVSNYKYSPFHGHIASDNIDQYINDELVKKINEDMKDYVQHQFDVNKNLWCYGASYRMYNEHCYRKKPYFMLKNLKYENDTFSIDIFLNKTTDLFNLMQPVFDDLILPIAEYFHPSDRTLLFQKWENVDTARITFWNAYFMTQKIKLPEQTGYLFPHQEWSLTKMKKMEETNISNLLNFDIWDIKCNILRGFHKSSKKSTGGILALDTGLGKTICIIEIIKQNPTKTLIVVPLTLLDQWKKELAKFYPEASVSEFYGKKKSLDGDIVLTTYGTVQQNYLTPFDRVVFDECHTLKSCNSATAYACSNITATKRWCVTATPFNNSIDSIIPYLHILNIEPWGTGYVSQRLNQKLIEKPKLLGFIISKIFIRITKEYLTKMEMNPLTKNITYINKEIKMNETHKALYSYMHEKVKNNMINLISISGTSRNYYKILMLYNQLHMICLHPNILDMSYYGNTIENYEINQKTLENMHFDGGNAYQKNVEKQLEELANDSSNADTCVICMEPFTRPTITSCFHVFCHECITQSLKFKKKCPTCRNPLQLSKLTEMVQEEEVVENEGIITFFDIKNRKKEIPKEIHDMYHSNVESNKMKYLYNKIRSNPDVSFILFSQFTNCLRHVKEFLLKNNMSVEMIDGKKTRVQRRKAIDKFQNGEIKVFLLSTKCSSVGLTLTTSYHMMFLEPIIDQQLFDQAIGRVFRIGQKNNVTIETLYSKNTIENINNIKKYKKCIINQRNNKKTKINYLRTSLEIC